MDASTLLNDAAAENPAGAVSTALDPNTREYGLQVGATAQPNLPAPAANVDLTNAAAPNPEGTGGYAERLAAAANQIGVLPGLGGWAKSLVASSLAALPKSSVASPIAQDSWGAPQTPPPQPTRAGRIMHGIAGAANTIGTALGDASHANDHPGGGWLSGVTSTLAARGERLDREKTQAAITAEANSKMLYTQKLLHRLDEADVLASISSGKQELEKLRTAPVPGRIIAADVTSDQAPQLIKDGRYDPAIDTAYATGQKIVGTDADGNPIKRTTYTITTLPQQITLGDTKDQKKDAALIERWNRYAPPANGGKWQVGQQLTGAEFNAIAQSADDAEASTRARDKTLRDNEISDAEQDKMSQSRSLKIESRRKRNAITERKRHKRKQRVLFPI